jgi:transposase-like protein
VHKLRNLIAHAPKRLADEIAADYADMIYADNPKGVEKRRKAFLRKWRDKCEAVATSLEEAGDQLFTFTRLPVEQWKSARTTNAIEQSASGVQAAHQDADRAALGRDGGDAVLGAARLRPDRAQKGRRLDDDRTTPCRAD